MASATSLTVRNATLEDLDQVAVLAAELVRLHHTWDPLRFMLPPNVEQGYRWWLERELENEEALVLVAVDEANRVLGYAYGRMEERDWAALREACGALHDIFVGPGERRRGVARALLAGVFDRFVARGAPRVVLHTAWQNAPAQALFKRVGFRETMIEMTRELALSDRSA